MPPLIDVTGKVEERPVPRLLVGLRGDSVTGVVDLREESGQSSQIYVRDGSPVHAVLPNAVDRLDQMLVEARLISEADIARAQSVRDKSGLLMGQVLCQMGLVADEQLSEVLRWQLKRKVTRLFSADGGTFKVISENHPFGVTASSPGMAIDSRALVFPGILSTYSDNKLVAELSALAGRMVRLRPVSSAQLGELGFGATHAPLLMHLRLAGFRLDEAWIHGAMGPRPREAKALMLSLFYLDLLAMDRAQARPATARPASVPIARIVTPPPMPAYSPASARSITPPPMPAYSPSSARSITPPPMPAYSPARSITPPPMPAYSPSPARSPTPAPMPAYSGPSARSLTPPPMPAYTGPQRTPTPLPQLDAPQLMELAQRYFSKGDLNRAEQAFEAVHGLDPGNKRVHAYLGWMAFWKKTGAERTAAIEPALKLLREALRAEPTFALGHYFVGELAKLQKDLVRAEAAFRAALTHDPNLMEAQRELRLMTMRKAR